MTRLWVDGRADGLVRADDRGFTLGDGVFDTLVAFGGMPFLGDRHLKRLVAHADAIGIALDPGRVKAGWVAALAEAGLPPVILRTTVTRGSGLRGLWPDPAAAGEPTIVVATAPWDPSLAGRPVCFTTAKGRRNETSPSARLKALGYLDHVLATRDAMAAGASDALFLNTAGRVACTTIANVFTIRDGEVVTPPETDGAMPGIMRALVLERAAAAGLRAREGRLGPDDLRDAELVLATNSVRFLSRVESLDGAPLRDAGHAAGLALHRAVEEQLQAECRADLPPMI